MFERSFKDIMTAAYRGAKQRGFWEGDRNEGEAIALMHSELSEALEAYREGNPASEKIPTFTKAEEEFADAVIRIAEWCEGKGLRIDRAIEAKLEYNTTRPHKHGKKF